MAFLCRRRRMVKLKFSYFFMERARSQQISCKRKLNRKGIYGNNLCANKQFPSDNATDIDMLPDDILVIILSHMSLKEAAGTSVLAHRWKYLWRSVFGTLQFDFRDFVTAAGDATELKKFLSWVNTVVELHQGRYIEGMVISMEGMQVNHYNKVPKAYDAIDSWVYFAVEKEVERFELRLSPLYGYEFPSIEMLISSHSHPFCRVRTLRLDFVEIKNEVFHYFLASSPNLEHLCLWNCIVTESLRVVDPPSLRVLQINRCHWIQSLEVSGESIVSLAFRGRRGKLLLKKLPNLRELTMGDDFFLHFVSEPKEQQFSYLDQLVKLVVCLEIPQCDRPIVGLPDLPRLCSIKRLEVKVFSQTGRSLLFFTSLIKACPRLCEFRIEISYEVADWALSVKKIPFPAISAVEFDHTSLKVVEMGGYVGCSSENKLLSELVKNSASSIDTVVIDTRSDYYDDPVLPYCIQREATSPCAYLFPELGAATQAESKDRARHLVSTFPNQIKFIIT